MADPRAGIRGRARLKSQDPRARRNAGYQSTKGEYGFGLDIDSSGVLFVDASQFTGVVVRVADLEAPIVYKGGKATLDLGDGLEVVRNKLALEKVRVVSDSTATNVAALVTDFNNLLAEMRLAAHLTR